MLTPCNHGCERRPGSLSSGSMENALYYTLSTIAQTLAGALAVLVAFELLRLSRLDDAITQGRAELQSRYGDWAKATSRPASRSDFDATMTTAADVQGRPVSIKEIGAPGVTRTPGTQFRKLLLYPPELRGRQVSVATWNILASGGSEEVGGLHIARGQEPA